MSFVDDVREGIATLAARDASCAQFGADAHRYRWRAPLSEQRLAAIEEQLGVQLPAAYRAMVGELGDGGPGPGYGLVRLDHPAQLGGAARACKLEGPLRPPRGVADDDPYWGSEQLDGMVLLADRGCGYASLLVVKGPMSGKVFADVRGAGDGVVPTHDGVESWYREWLACALQTPPVAPCVALAEYCAPPNALANYLAHTEEKLGVGAGELGEDDLRSALLGINDGGLAIREGGDAPGRFINGGDAARPCSCCQAMLDRFVARGMMRPQQLAAGLPLIPSREVEA